MLWSNERIALAVKECYGAVESQAAGVARSLMYGVRDEYESNVAKLQDSHGELVADQLNIARLLHDAGVEYSGLKRQAPRVEILLDRLRGSQHNVICLVKERKNACRRSAELEAAIEAKDAYITELERKNERLELRIDSIMEEM